MTTLAFFMFFFHERCCVVKKGNVNVAAPVAGPLAAAPTALSYHGISTDLEERKKYLEL
jgi:hypothetical protein